MNQSQTPLFDALVHFQQKEKVSYHVPGHKNGKIFLEKGKPFYQSLLSIDATELTGLDDLHAPEGSILEAQELLTDFYQSKKSYFLVNGSTVGNLTMILATCQEGDTVLVQRNCHQSILHGLMLANVKPVFIAPQYYENWGIASGVNLKIVKEALIAYPNTKAIILTYPNYYGLAEEISPIIALVHEKNIPVLVDEAHGAHFIIGTPFPKSSLAIGADIVVHSAHKTLPAMTMGSYLHVNSPLIDIKQVELYLHILQSSSPSYPIMGSLDLARAYLASYSQQDVDSLIRKIAQFTAQLASIPEIKILEPPVGRELDPLKLTIQSKRGLSGYELQKLLETKGVYTELADSQNVLFVLPLLKKEEDYPFKQTINQMKEAVKGQIGEAINDCNWRNALEEITSLSMSYSDMKQAIKQQVPLHKAIGKISGEMVIPYPPGIPLIMSGELITEEKINTLKNLITLHSHFHGGTALKDGKLVVYEAMKD